MSTIISVRMNESEAELLTNAAEIYGIGISSLLKKLAIEKLEDDFDLSLIREYEIDKKKGIQTKPIDELFNEMGI